jgi:hypothetical protein
MAARADDQRGTVVGVEREPLFEDLQRAGLQPRLPVSLRKGREDQTGGRLPPLLEFFDFAGDGHTAALRKSLPSSWLANSLPLRSGFGSGGPCA